MQEVATKPENQPRVPVISSDGLPLIPCRPKRARVLLEQGKATKAWIKGNFAIRMTDRTRAESNVPEMTLSITPGSKTTGFAVTEDQENQDETPERQVVQMIELGMGGLTEKSPEALQVSLHLHTIQLRSSTEHYSCGKNT